MATGEDDCFKRSVDLLYSISIDCIGQISLCAESILIAVVDSRSAAMPKTRKLSGLPCSEQIFLRFATISQYTTKYSKRKLVQVYLK
jgi:hypothetical protein